MVGVFLAVGTSLLANAAKGRAEGDRPLGCWANCCNAWRNLMSCPMSLGRNFQDLGEFKQILGQRLSARHRAVRPRRATRRLFTWRALRTTQRLPPRAEADLSTPPRPAGGTRLCLSLRGRRSPRRRQAARPARSSVGLQDCLGRGCVEVFVVAGRGY